jgi:fatty acid desaturase
MGIAFTQVAFLGHDSGHQQIFVRRRPNDVLGQFMGTLTGLSYGWWVGKHNRHHSHPNTEGYDPDIGDGVLAFTARQAVGRSGRFGRFIVRRQAWLFFPLLLLEGLNLHASSILAQTPGGNRSRRGGSRGTEIALLTAHAVIYLTAVLLVMPPVMALAFVAVHQSVWGLYMGCSFAPNHKGMPIISDDAEVDYLRRQVLTSRNVRGGTFTDLLLGGLNYQIEHHLFPSMPRTALPQAQKLVRAYCAELEIPYTETSLPGSYAAALRHLNDLGAPLRAGPALRSRPEPST